MNQNFLCTLVAFNKPCDETVAKNVAMQIAAMSPIALDEASVPQNVKDAEFNADIDKAKQNQVQKAVENALKKAGINPAHVDSEDHIASNTEKGWITFSLCAVTNTNSLYKNFILYSNSYTTLCSSLPNLRWTKRTTSPTATAVAPSSSILTQTANGRATVLSIVPPNWIMQNCTTATIAMRMKKLRLRVMLPNADSPQRTLLALNMWKI